MEHNEVDQFDLSPLPWSDLEGLERHLDATRNNIPNVNKEELHAKIVAEDLKYLEAERKTVKDFAMGYFSEDFETESESDFNKDAVQEEAFREAKKDPSQPDSHDSTEEGCLLASSE